jgi:bacteriocin biosynthesis cyclodehydratase domain-containing protein
MPSDRPDSGVPLPRRPVLLPGLRVLRRGPGEVQIGLDPRRAVVLAATDAVRRTLAVLAVAGPSDQADPAVLAGLARLGLLVEHAGTPRPTSGRVAVLGFGSSPMPDPADLLRAAGLDPGGAQDHDRDADVGLLVGAGEPDRDLLDPWVRDGLPHLVVRVTEGVAVVGPFVAPGHTACLRCVDAHHTDADPRWPLLVAQQAAQTARARPDGVPEPVDPVLAGLALAWAVRDLASHAEGRRPATWSATLRLPPDLADGESVTWLRHPECGCSWNTVSEWAS